MASGGVAVAPKTATFVHTGVRELTLVEEPAPACPEDGVLIRATGSVVNTGTDIRIYRGRGIDRRPESYPKPAGYCLVGRVEAVGPGAERFRPGDRVFAMGPFTTLCAASAEMAITVPEDVPDELAAFTDLLDIGLHAIRQGEPTPGEYVAVIGQGVIGQGALACARALGFRTVAIDPDEHRRAVSRRIGADLVLSPDQPDFAARIEAFTRGEGVDLVVEAASVWPAIELGYGIVRPAGKVVVPARHLDLPDWSPVGGEYQRREITLRTSQSYTRFPGFESYPPDVHRWSRRRNFELIWDLIASGRLNIDPLITDRVGFAELPDVFARLDADDRRMIGVYVTIP
ncbi:MAG TPA: zinc-binding alcohol dehydrogenase [Chloroflexota bacterium]|nr:zinc-binding alcohol dehydrogenase [Chloroflexota bacterium]